MLASLHASVLHLSPSLLYLLLYLLHLSSCPSCSSLPALPSADHALIICKGRLVPPCAVPLSWCSPTRFPIYLTSSRQNRSVSKFCLLPFFLFPFLQQSSVSFVQLWFSHSLYSQNYPSVHPFIQPAPFSPFLLTSPNPTAVGSECRRDRAWAKISSPRRSLSMYQLIGINLHPRILVLLLCSSSPLQAPLFYCLLP